MHRYRRAAAKIDLDAVLNNFNEVKKRINKDTKIMAVLKADGYGHGAVPLAELLKDKADYYGVSIIEEAMELRTSGITNPILILGYTSPDRFQELLLNDLEQTIFQLPVAEKLSHSAVEIGKVAKIHIKVDTGMTRLGISACSESIEIVKQIANLPNIEIRGIYSHNACADLRDKTCEENQKKRFLDFIAGIEKSGISIPIKHICNSAAIVDDDDYFDMVRTGLLLYGLFPSDEVHKERLNLIPAMELKTQVIFIHSVEAGQGVSYGHTYITTRRTKIAVLSIGYADGYPRSLSSKGRVLIKGQYAPIIGRVCMDMMMVDVTDIDGVEVEDEVTLIGTEGERTITAEEIGELSGSFNYEIVCGISKRVPKIFYRDNTEVLFLSNFDKG